MKKPKIKLLTITIIFVIVLASLTVCYAAFTNTVTIEKEMELPDDIQALLEGGN